MYFNSLQPREDDEGKGSDSGEVNRKVVSRVAVY